MDVGKNVGFSKGTPWIEPAQNDISVEAALKDETSIFIIIKPFAGFEKNLM